jgi:hypothetical protein
MERPERVGLLSSQHAGLLKRVGTLLRGAVRREPSPAAEPAVPDEQGIEALRHRVAHLEAMVEGLQDAVYRQSAQHHERLEELRRKTEPGEIARALSDDVRKRGL